MATVEVPSEFSKTVKVGTSDIKILPPSAENFKEELSGKIDAAGRKLKLDEPPPHDPSDPLFADLDTPASPTASDSERISTNNNSRKTVEPGRYSESQSGYSSVAAPPEFSETVKFGTSNLVTLPPTVQSVREELPEMIESATRSLKLCKR